MHSSRLTSLTACDVRIITAIEKTQSYGLQSLLARVNESSLTGLPCRDLYPLIALTEDLRRKKLISLGRMAHSASLKSIWPSTCRPLLWICSILQKSKNEEVWSSSFPLPWNVLHIAYAFLVLVIDTLLPRRSYNSSGRLDCKSLCQIMLLWLPLPQNPWAQTSDCALSSVTALV